MKIGRQILCFIILLGSAFGIWLPQAVFAQDGTIEEKLEAVKRIEIAPVYSTLEAASGEEFEFEVEFMYVGAMPRVFELRASGPGGWSVYMTPYFDREKRIRDISLVPSFNFGDKIRVVAVSPFIPPVEPGEYKINLEVVSGDGDIATAIELKAIITARYSLILVPSAERLNTTAIAGRDNFFSIDAGNLGTAAIDNIKFSVSKPEGWAVEFSPEKMARFTALDAQTVNVNIKPPPRTIAGDYSVKIQASGDQVTSNELDIRVTVESSTIWGWVGVAIILVVSGGLIFMFLRFSRR